MLAVNLNTIQVFKQFRLIEGTQPCYGWKGGWVRGVATSGLQRFNLAAVLCSLRQLEVRPA